MQSSTNSRAVYPNTKRPYSEEQEQAARRYLHSVEQAAQAEEGIGGQQHGPPEGSSPLTPAATNASTADRSSGVAPQRRTLFGRARALVSVVPFYLSP
jgi:hypothetical protein